MTEPNEALKAWFAHRVKTVHDTVSVFDVLRRHGISLRHTSDRMEQISCPFHGKDANPSARVYPGSPTSPSHIWCFVCRERWDTIGLWKKFGGDETKKFHQVLSEIEKAFGITPPEISREAFAKAADATHKEEFESLYQMCENRLISVREDFVAFQDMIGYLTIGSVLDKVLSGVTEGRVTFKEGIEVLQQLRLRISARIQRGHAASSSAYP